jgi:hypothetical protein
MAARYDVGDCGLPTSSGPCPDDIAPDKQGDFGRVIAPDGAPIPPPPEDRQGAACGAEDEVAVGGFDDAGYAADCLKAWAISLGKADGSFGENDPLLRSQVSSLLARLLERDGVALDNTRSFPDVNPDTVPNGQVRSEIEHLAGAGIIAGFPDGTFGPAGSLSVAQAATFVVRTIQFAHAHNPTAPNLHDKGNTRANYDYAIRQLLLDTSAADINTEPYAAAPTDPTARGLLADSLSRALGRLGKVFVLDCKAAQDQGVAPLHRGDPYYRPPLDPDGDGTAC